MYARSESLVEDMSGRIQVPDTCSELALHGNPGFNRTSIESKGLGSMVLNVYLSPWSVPS